MHGRARWGTGEEAEVEAKVKVKEEKEVGPSFVAPTRDQGLRTKDRRRDDEGRGDASGAA